MTGLRSAEQLLLVEEITHRVVDEYTNAIASISAEASRISDEDARAALGRAVARLYAYANAHRALRSPACEGDLDLGEYLGRLCVALYNAALRECGVKLILLDEHIELASERCWRVGLIVAELVTNSFRHGYRGRSRAIVVELRLAGRDVCCRVADDGGSLPNPTASRGRRAIAALARDLGGDVTWDFRADGVTATLSFPLSPGASLAIAKSDSAAALGGVG
jgi:two-component sensor histidine kinase